MMKLWGGRFEEGSSALLERFNASITFDKKLYRYDILGSLAHAKMLHSIKILNDKEYADICHGLQEIESEISNGEFTFNISDEDIHMAIESALTQKIGQAGKKLHTARSRNDQVALDFRMYVLDSNYNIRQQILELIEVIITLAKSHTKTLMPGMTHLQHAQPINFGFHLVAWCCALKRDIERLESSFVRNNFMPLGSGALAGTPYETDREMIARELGFKAPTLNAMDSVSDRDFALDVLYDLAMLGMHISRIAEELVLWSSYEFKFITISDKYATGSSIMPQKKNPDVPELVRGKSGRLYGNLISLLVVMKSLPLAYNKDTQEDKEPVFDSVENITISLEILKETLKTLTINKDNMLKACKIGHLSATDLADFLVKTSNIPFRQAHHITGKIVAYAESKHCDISDLSEDEIIGLDPTIKSGIKEVLDIAHSMESRKSLGGTSSTQTMQQICTLETWLQSTKDTIPNTKPTYTQHISTSNNPSK
ncbi:argininosuccinate lyase [Helicobacter fennelliae]|nr:argininosuccinate lyase [Helicobacter fennelliae]